MKHALLLVLTLLLSLLAALHAGYDPNVLPKGANTSICATGWRTAS